MATDSENISLQQRALTLTLAALDVADDRRDAWLAAQCRDDPALREEVAALLRHDRADDVLERLCEDGAAQASGGDPMPGRLVGRFRVGQRLGSGGMGTVYRAEPVGGVARLPVALKLIKRGMDSEEILARFMRERDILARLDHPNIARLLDGGMTDDGQPWFALELVEGEPLSAYCDARQLGIEARLALFLTICDAVAYAHRNLVVHRDIKPGNLLVSADGVVKLLDFGIAKLLDPASDGATVGSPMMTPEYAAPEQFDHGAITTQTDVYQLGMLLCELLCGLRPPAASGKPRQRGDLPAARIDRLLRDPAGAPAGTTTEAIARARGTSSSALRRCLRGDLDRIVRRAYHAEPERRYSSVAALADDLRRYRAGLPVMAMDDSVPYRLRKFVRRHRVVVSAACAVLLALAGGLGLALREAHELRRSERQTESALNMIEDVFLGADPYAAKGGETRVVDLLTRARERVAADIDSQPAIAARLLSEIGSAYVSLDDRAAAEGALHDAVRAGIQAGPAARVPVASAQARLAHYQAVTDGDAKALPQLEAAIASLRAAGPDGWSALAQALQFRNDYDFNTGNYAPIAARSEEVVDLNRRASGTDSTEYAMSLGIQASLLRAVGREADALGVAREAHERVVAMGDAAPLGVRLYVDQQYAGALSANGRSAEAEPVLREALAAAERLGSDSNLAIGLAWELANVQSAIGRLDEAADALRHLLDLMHASKSANVAAVHNALGVIELARRRHREADVELEAAASAVCADSMTSPPCLAVRLNRAEAQLVLLPPATARRTLDALSADIGGEPGRARERWRLLESRWQLARGNADDAATALAPVLEAARKPDATGGVDAAPVFVQSAAIHEAQHHPDLALADYAEAERRMAAAWSVEAEPLREVRRRIAALPARAIAAPSG